MMKKLSMFFCLLAMVMISQSAWAKQGDKTVYQVSWSHANMNSLTDGKFVKQSDNGLVDVTMYSTDATPTAITYRDDYDPEELMSASVGRLVMGKCKSGQFNFNLGWSVPSDKSGYSLQVIDARLLARSYVAFGVAAAWCKWGAEKEVSISIGSYNITEELKTSNIAATATTLPFYFRRDATLHREFNVTKLQMDVYITPEAPTWLKEKDTVNVTVNHTKDIYIHWIDLKSYVNLTGNIFAESIRFEAVDPKTAKYLVWNEDRTKVYAVKPGVYQFATYFDKKDGQYCSSAYAASNLKLTFVADPDDENLAQMFYFVDDVMATEYDMVNHYWMVDIPWTVENKHWVEYVYAYDDPIQFVRQSTHALEYLPDTKENEDHFNVLQITAVDTTILTVNDAHRSWLEYHASKAPNHVKFVMNSEALKNALVTKTNDASWNNSQLDMEFAEKSVGQMSNHRYFEVTFLGVPDSLFFSYGSNAQQQADNTRMRIEYATNAGDWTELGTIEGKPTGEGNTYAYKLQPNANQLRFSYWGCQYVGWIKNLTVTERKEIKLTDIPVADMVVIKGRHQKGGMVVQEHPMAWYNLYPSYQDTLHAATANVFTITPSGVKTFALDAYQEDAKIEFGLKLDTVGEFTTTFMMWNGTPNTREIVAGGKAVYGCYLRGVVGYNTDDITLVPAQDTIVLNPGLSKNIAFTVKDYAGTEIPASFLQWSYQAESVDSIISVDSLGRVTARCTGNAHVLVTLLENDLVPTKYYDLPIRVVEATPQAILWRNYSSGLGVGETIEGLAYTQDEAAITYQFSPAGLAQDLGGNKIQIGDNPGNITIKAFAATTCEHDTISAVKSFVIKKPIPKDSIVIDVPTYPVAVEDSIKDLVVPKDTSIHVEYSFNPADAAKVVEGNIIVLNHAIDTLWIYIHTWGEYYADRYDTTFIKVLRADEWIEFVGGHIGDTLWLDQKYNTAKYGTITRSGEAADTVWYVGAEPDMLEIDLNSSLLSFFPRKTGQITLYVRSPGNKDYKGPATNNKKVWLAKHVKPINWNLLNPQPLDERRVNDTIFVTDVPVVDQYGEDIKDSVLRSYEFLPNTGIATVNEDGDIVVKKPNEEVYVVVTTYGPGIETRIDTLGPIKATGYEVGSVDVEFPDSIHVGDVLSVNNAKVYDQAGMDITDKCDDVSFVVKPSDVASYDPQTGLITVNKAAEFTVTATVVGASLVPQSTVISQTFPVLTYENIQIEFPEKPAGEEYLPGDTVKLSDIVIKDEDGKDITDLTDIVVSWEPEENAHIDPETGDLIIDKPGDLDIEINVTGEGIDSTKFEQEIQAEPYTIDEIDFPVLPSEDFLKGDSIDINDITIYDERGRDITDDCNIKITWEPEENAHIDEETGKLVIDKSGDLDIKYEITGELINDLDTTLEVKVDQFEVGKVITPMNPDKIYRVGDEFAIDDIIIIDVNGDTITSEATLEFSFEPEGAAHVDEQTGMIVIDKAEDPLKINVKISGEDVAETSVSQEIHVKKYETGKIELPEEPVDDYRQGDKIDPSDIVVYDENGKPITDQEIDIEFTWEPQENAHLDEDGNLVFDQPGEITVTTCVSGEGITTECSTETYFIRHDQSACIDQFTKENMIVQLWSDVVIVNNNVKGYNFVSYQWYWNEQELPGETGQALRTNGVALDGLYYAIAKDAAGKEYLLCELEITPASSSTNGKLMHVVPTILSGNERYTIEAGQAGEVYVTNSNGNAMQRFSIEEGQSSVNAPAAAGVYVLHYQAKDGQIATQKLIVK